MRVLLTTDTIGGVWTFTRELASGLLESGHQLALVSLGRQPSPDQQAWVDGIALLFKDSFRYEALDNPLEWMQDNDCAYTGCAQALLDRIEHFTPHIIHSNQFCFGSLPVPVPKLITAHSDVLSWADACRPNGLEASSWLERYKSLVQKGLDHADAVAAPTQHMLADLTRHFHVSCPAFAISNGRRLPPENRPVQRLSQAVSVGRLWDEAKGLSTLLEINSPVPIVIAGEEQFENAEASTGAAQVTALGILSEAELIELFRRSSIYIAPSWYEPFGLAPLEAALCGCAIVARDIPSLREVWGNAGRYFSTTGELERQLHALVDSPDDLRRAQTEARQRAEEFTTARMTASYVAVYEELIDRANGTGKQHKEFARHAA